MALNTKAFDTLVSEFAVNVQGRTAALIDFAVGSILRAVGEAASLVVLWLQGLVLQVLALTRFATSTGTDAESWAADFGFEKIPATHATGSVTFARFTTGRRAVIYPAALVQTADGSQTYAVVADTAHPAWSPADSAYVVDADASGVAVPVQALAAGAAGNAAAGQVSVIVGQGIPYIDTATNAAPFTGGADIEGDGAFRARFVLWFNSLSKATGTALDYAIGQVQSGLKWKLVENQNLDGSPRPGHLYAVVDDGTGDPSDELLAAVRAAMEGVRALSIQYAVFPPEVLGADVSLMLEIAAGFDPGEVQVAVRDAVLAYLGGLDLGQELRWTKLVQIAYDAAPGGVTNVRTILVNGQMRDLEASDRQVIRAGTVVVG
ncbi:baseplate J/gp47 family protein [Methylomagnum ishizawai]|uniref:baseplate J/gp47 family protein n=1 Tax=Methylomagnum ishizawai TaxID=1760988 RepID=UPI001C33E62D|nr:baseplate J/gp47 family protein [Methylomagnum ishizawai]BBL73225.1 hypothetical protein MishRS11D_03230 [Methylomagnum ishizawai]